MTPEERQQLLAEKPFHVKADGSGCECVMCLQLRERPICQSCHEPWPCAKAQQIADLEGK